MNQITVKGVKPESFAFNDEEYTELKRKQDAAIARGEEGHTIYQVGRVVTKPYSSPACEGLHSAPLKDAAWCLGYGPIILVVEHVDENGVPLPLKDLTPGRQKGGYISRYQKVIKAFDFRTVKGVKDFFAFAAANGVSPEEIGNYGINKACESDLGSEAYEEFYHCARLPVPLTPEEMLEDIRVKKLARETVAEAQIETHPSLWLKIKAWFKRPST